MFKHLFSASEEIVRIVLTANGRSVLVNVFDQVSYLWIIHHRNGMLLKRESESIKLMIDESIYDRTFGIIR